VWVVAQWSAQSQQISKSRLHCPVLRLLFKADARRLAKDAGCGVRGAETNGLTVLRTVLKRPHTICFYDAKLWLASQRFDVFRIPRKSVVVNCSGRGSS
jgi:hypothetical protein